MKARHVQEMKDLGDIIYAMELRYSERESEAAQNFQSLMDELKNKVAKSRLVATSRLFSKYILEFGGYTLTECPAESRSRRFMDRISEGDQTLQRQHRGEETEI